MYENPKRNKCLDDCNVGIVNCTWVWTCLVSELEITCKDISTENLEKDLHDNKVDLSTCEVALSQGISTCKGIALVQGVSTLSINDKILANNKFIEMISKELKRRATYTAIKQVS
jgi:hypothetical protein